MKKFACLCVLFIFLLCSACGNTKYHDNKGNAKVDDEVPKTDAVSQNKLTYSDLSTNCLNFPLFSRLYGIPNLKICILFPCFCPYQQVTRESF